MNTIVVSEAGTDSGIEGNPAMSIVQLQLPNQPLQVQSVIQPSHTSVIQTATGLQTIHVHPLAQDTDSDDDDDDDDGLARKRREILARRPSYRRILNELSSDQAPITVAKIEEESDSRDPGSPGDTVETQEATHHLSEVQYQTVMPGQIQIGAGDTQGLQTLTMTNVNSSNAATAGTTIVQYAQGPDGQFFIPANTVQAYQLAGPAGGKLPEGFTVMAGPTAINAAPQHFTEDAQRKRELRLLKNKDAARECRRKKKEYVKCLENRVAVLENQNKALIEELKSLKELYCQKEG